ncbi:MAG: methionyl-tRNA formyltransferase, partial [bacterium]|nr:methionyl-tRNA formyltransferase [bacterium]
MPTDASTVVFMGSPDFAVPTLEALMAASDFDVVCVVSQPDRPRGRGKKILPTPVRACAERHGIATLQMSKARYGPVAAEIATLAPDFLVVTAFGIILKPDLLDLARFGCVNLHASLLPKYRGVSPVQAAILNGDAETGCTTMMVDEGVDTGDILLTAVTATRSDDTAGKLEARLSEIGAPLVVKTLRGL